MDRIKEGCEYLHDMFIYDPYKYLSVVGAFSCSALPIQRSGPRGIGVEAWTANGKEGMRYEVRRIDLQDNQN